MGNGVRKVRSFY